MDEDEQVPGGYPGWAPRGTCPFCGSGQVHHEVLGMPTVDAVESAPPWVSFGCVWGPWDRRCESCERSWTAGVEDDALENQAYLEAQAGEGSGYEGE